MQVWLVTTDNLDYDGDTSFVHICATKELAEYYLAQLAKWAPTWAKYARIKKVHVATEGD